VGIITSQKSEYSLFSVTQQPNLGLDRLVKEVPSSHRIRQSQPVGIP